MRATVTRLAKLSPKLKEIRIHLCQTGEASKGVMEYVQKFYPNPNLPILIRECSGVQPRLWVRYDLGKETSISLANSAALDVQ